MIMSTNVTLTTIVTKIYKTTTTTAAAAAAAAAITKSIN